MPVGAGPAMAVGRGRRMMLRRSKGFTLMELLVATVLLSLVMTAVYTLFHSAIGTWKILEENGDRPRAARYAVTLLEKDIQRLSPALAHFMEGDEKEAALFVYGSAMNVELREGKHLLRVRYYYDAAKQQLLRQESRVDYSIPQRTVQDEENQGIPFSLEDEQVFVIADNVTQFELHYGWIPAVEQAPDAPPEPREIFYTQQHKTGWGMPQVLRFRFQMEDTERDTPIEVERTLPLRASLYRHPLDALLDREEGGI